ncbi:MAG TPA: GNAT family N-acetyltransferase [Roseiflexaceae bacterium]|nr:GNAT family N-acetyltransferase [Roseiflexaceae bacterium]
MGVRIREFVAADAEAVSALIQQTMRVSNSRDYAAERLQPLIDYFTPAKVRQLAAERYCLVAETADSIVATAALDGDEIVTFFVEPAQQGGGIGSRLLEALEAFAREQGMEQLRVDASLTGTPFYERKGYLRTGAELDGTAGPQVSMRKTIQP